MTSVTLNKVIHEQARLKILVLLATSPEPETAFTDIKKKLDLTAGNLSIQLKTLEEAGFITVKKFFNGNKPKTDVRITEEGRNSLMAYMNELEKLLSAVKNDTE